MAIKFYPQFEQVLAQFKTSASQPDQYGKIKIVFITAGAMSDESGDLSPLSFREAVQKNIGTLAIKVDPPHYNLIKHLLQPKIDLSISLLAKPWAMENSSGLSYQLVEIQKATDLLS